jgi:hypothetical protein
MIERDRRRETLQLPCKTGDVVEPADGLEETALGRFDGSTVELDDARPAFTRALDEGRRTPDLPIPAIPCMQITCASPPSSSSRARSSASRPTKGTRRRWGIAVAMTAVSTARAPRCKDGCRRARTTPTGSLRCTSTFL